MRPHVADRLRSDDRDLPPRRQVVREQFKYRGLRVGVHHTEVPDQHARDAFEPAGDLESRQMAVDAVRRLFDVLHEKPASIRSQAPADPPAHQGRQNGQTPAHQAYMARNKFPATKFPANRLEAKVPRTTRPPAGAHLRQEAPELGEGVTCHRGRA